MMGVFAPEGMEVLANPNEFFLAVIAEALMKQKPWEAF
jgi:hypothetical protein